MQELHRLLKFLIIINYLQHSLYWEGGLGDRDDALFRVEYSPGARSHARRR